MRVVHVFLAVANMALCLISLFLANAHGNPQFTGVFCVLGGVAGVSAVGMVATLDRIE